MFAYIVTLPPETQIALAGLVGLVVTLIFNAISIRLPWTAPFLTKWKEEITAALAGVVTGWLSAHLPGGAFEQASLYALNFVIALIVAVLAYGGIVLAKSFRIKSA